MHRQKNRTRWLLGWLRGVTRAVEAHRMPHEALPSAIDVALREGVPIETIAAIVEGAADERSDRPAPPAAAPPVLPPRVARRRAKASDR